MKEQLSIIIPVFNAQGTLGRCIESILSQTYDNLEIILVNDGSTDNSLKICKEYQSRDSRIILINQENKGAVKSREAGVKIAKGRFISFCDCDDWIEPHMYSAMMENISNNSVEIAVTALKHDRLDGTQTLISAAIPEGIYNKEKTERIISSHLIQGYFTSPCNKIFSAHLVKKHACNLNEEISGYFDDGVWVIPCILEAKGIFISNESFYHYVENDKSVTHNWGEMTLYKANLIINHWLNYINMADISAYEARGINLCIREIVRYATELLAGDIQYPKFTLSTLDEILHKRIVLYGAGIVGRSYKYMIDINNLCDVVLWVDKNTKTDLRISDVKSIDETSYDVILIAVKSKSMAEEIERELSPRKCLWIEPRPIPYDSTMI